MAAPLALTGRLLQFCTQHRKQPLKKTDGKSDHVVIVSNPVTCLLTQVCPLLDTWNYRHTGSNSVN